MVIAIWIVDLRRIPTGSTDRVSRAGGPRRSRSASRARLASRSPTIRRSRCAIEAHRRRAAGAEPRSAGGAARGRPGPNCPWSITGSWPAERGDIRIGAVSLRVRSPWAIAERWLSAPTAQTVRVFPDLADARRQSMFLLRSRQVALEKRRARVAGLGRDFESLRDYQPGRRAARHLLDGDGASSEAGHQASTSRSEARRCGFWWMRGGCCGPGCGTAPSSTRWSTRRSGSRRLRSAPAIASVC